MSAGDASGGDRWHQIYEAEYAAGNMGAQVSEWQAFCSCGWVSPRTQVRKDYVQMTREHLTATGPRP